MKITNLMLFKTNSMAQTISCTLISHNQAKTSRGTVRAQTIILAAQVNQCIHKLTQSLQHHYCTIYMSNLNRRGTWTNELSITSLYSSTTCQWRYNTKEAASSLYVTILCSTTLILVTHYCISLPLKPTLSSITFSVYVTYPKTSLAYLNSLVITVSSLNFIVNHV